MKKRDYSLDLLRLLACMMVVIMHSPMPNANANEMLASSISYLTAPCIGLFFMVSGALLLPPPIGDASVSASVFLRRRLKKVLFPTVFWTFFYLGLNVFEGNMTFQEGVIAVLSIPFSAQGHGILWFMYTLIGLYLLTPILQAWLRTATEREIQFYLLLWAVTMCYPLLGLLLKVQTDTQGILYYFTGYVGYFLLGYYLQYYGKSVTLSKAMIGMLLALISPVVVKLMNWEVDFYSVFWYLSIFVALQCLFWWKLFKCLYAKCLFKETKLKWVAVFSNLSFGIYLSHIFLMRYMLWKMDWIINISSYLLQTFVIAVITFVSAACLSYLISYTKLGNMLIGYQQRTNS